MSLRPSVCPLMSYTYCMCPYVGFRTRRQQILFCHLGGYNKCNSVSDNLRKVNKVYQTLKCLVLLHFVCLQNTKYERATCFNSNQIHSFIIHAVLRRSVQQVCGDNLRVIAPSEATRHLSKKYCSGGEPLVTLCPIRLT